MSTWTSRAEQRERGRIEVFLAAVVDFLDTRTLSLAG